MLGIERKKRRDGGNSAVRKRIRNYNRHEVRKKMIQQRRQVIVQATRRKEEAKLCEYGEQWRSDAKPALNHLGKNQ